MQQNECGTNFDNEWKSSQRWQVKINQVRWLNLHDEIICHKIYDSGRTKKNLGNYARTVWSVINDWLVKFSTPPQKSIKILLPLSRLLARYLPYMIWQAAHHKNFHLFSFFYQLCHSNIAKSNVFPSLLVLDGIPGSGRRI